MATSSSPKTS